MGQWQLSLAIANSSPFPSRAATTWENNQAQLTSTGKESRRTAVERASSVTGPWDSSATNTEPASSLFEYIDTNSPAAAAFYRTSEP